MAEEKQDHGPAVLDGKLLYTSVSAMQKAHACVRQWRYKYVDRLPDKPPGKGQIRGTEGHKRIETYLRTGMDVLDPLERLGIEKGLIPAPGPDLLVEEHFGKPTPLYALHVPMIGYVDLTHARESEWITVRDWKFKKDLDAWASTSDELVSPESEAGIQMLGYGAWVAAITKDGRLPQRHVVELSHVTFQTQGRKEVRPTIVTIPLDTAVARWETVSRRLIPKMELAARAPHAQDVEKNENVCHRYGGCPYRQQCLDRLSKLTQGFRARKKEGKEPMGLLSSLTNKQPTAAQAPAAVVGSINAAQAVAGVIYGTVAGNFLKCEATTPTAVFFSDPAGNPVKLGPADQVYVANEAGIAAFNGQKVPEKPAEPAQGPEKKRLVIKDEAPALLPPDAPKSDPKLAAKVDAPAAPSQAPAPAASEKSQAPAASAGQANTTPVNEGAAGGPTPEEKPKRGRPAGSKNKDKPAEEPAPVETPAGKVEGLYLYFGCSPLGIASQSLSKFTEILDGMIREGAQLTCDDLRMCNTRELGFGMWKGMLAKVAVEEAQDRATEEEGKPRASYLPPGHYVVDSGDERIVTVASALRPVAALVVVGGGR